MPATLYRDANYGQFVVMPSGQKILTFEQEFDDEDFEAALSVLESVSATHGFREDGVAVWHLRDHPQVALAKLAEALAGRGYSDDPLGARTVAPFDPEEPLPAPPRKGLRVSERVDTGLRRHLEIAFAALRERGDLHSADVCHLARVETDTLGRPLPLTRARATLHRPVESVAEAQAALREALAPVKGALVRASVEESAPGTYAIEVAIAPSRSAVEEYVTAALPTFESADPIRGVRVARFVLNSPITAEAASAIEERAVACTAATSLARPNGRTVVLRVPSAILEGSYLSDNAFGSRIAWLARQLEEWGPDLDEIGQVEAVLPSDDAEAMRMLLAGARAQA